MNALDLETSCQLEEREYFASMTHVVKTSDCLITWTLEKKFSWFCGILLAVDATSLLVFVASRKRMAMAQP